MEDVRLVFSSLISLFTSFWNTALTGWGVFGTFVIFYAILRKIARTFNKLKGD